MPFCAILLGFYEGMFKGRMVFELVEQVGAAGPVLEAYAPNVERIRSFRVSSGT